MSPLVIYKADDRELTRSPRFAPAIPPASPRPRLDYFVNFPNDKRAYWYLVCFLCVFDWAHSAASVFVCPAFHPGLLVVFAGAQR